VETAETDAEAHKNAILALVEARLDMAIEELRGGS
jgi:hypothetical protein